ncbi:MAG: hypothetical protein JXB39_01740 [Deltaproteobacteria bacterium]|nr:hypothetical protein [Deltaproteobacteria bacterium]
MRLLLLSLLWTHPSQAVSLALPRAEICRLSTLVVTGEVTGLEARWSEPRPGEIETRADIAVDRVLKGATPEQGLVVVTPGGTLGDLLQRVEDAARLREDRRYLLLLAPVPGGWAPVGGEDGAILLEGPQGDGEDEATALAGLVGCL